LASDDLLTYLPTGVPDLFLPAPLCLEAPRKRDVQGAPRKQSNYSFFSLVFLIACLDLSQQGKLKKKFAKKLSGLIKTIWFCFLDFFSSLDLFIAFFLVFQNKGTSKMR
jgi:hypothetical protein